MSERVVEELLARYVEHRLARGERLPAEQLCGSREELVEPLRDCIRRYERLEQTLAAPVTETPVTPGEAELPAFDGFRTIERIGAGGGGEVYKLEDLELGRTVAAKVIRRDGPLQTTLGDFVREARSLALFEDPRIVRIFEFRGRADPPVLLMEHVEGFHLDHIAPSLEFGQRARLMIEICEAVHRAHSLGLQHRDLKPANILVDARLAPRILDFGLSGGDPDRGHGVGTPAYMAREQLEPGRPIDARTDVYALGVLFYEMLCGAQPFGGRTQDELVRAIHEAEPRLPAEVEPGVPEPLQAIALQAMEREPAARYASADEMARDLRRFLDDRPVTARPSLYQTALGRRLGPHLAQIREWLRLKLIYPHEAERLSEAYERLELREDDWIIRSRTLSFSQISLYLGALLLACGGLLYFAAYLNEAIDGLLPPLLVLGVPFAGLNLAAWRMFRRERQPVSVAFYLAALMLLPLFVLIVLFEVELWPVDGELRPELLEELWISNPQLQLASLLACAWACLVAWSTRTLTLAACFTGLALVFNLAVLGDFGLREWIEAENYDRIALHLVPALVAAAGVGRLAERRSLSWYARPLYVAAAGLFVLVLELLALNGEAFRYAGVSLAPFQPPSVDQPLLLDTLAAMTLNGLLIYAAGRLLERYGSELMRTPSRLLYALSPFAILQPIAYLNAVGEYSLRYAWFYLVLALAITFVSRFRQRRSFYYAGMLNTAAAVWYVTDLHGWWDRPLWAVVVVLIGLAVLGLGLRLHVIERDRRREPGGTPAARD